MVSILDVAYENVYQLSVYVHVCMCVYMCVCTYMCVCMYVCVCVCV